MNFQVVRVRRRGGTPAKPVIDLIKKAAPLAAKPKAPPPEPKRLHITAAPDGPPISEHLPEKHRKIENKVGRVLTDEQAQILGRIVQKAGVGHPSTLGLRLVLAASEDEHAVAWPIGQLSRALRLSGRPTEGEAVWKVAQGCRTSRYRDMAAAALALLNQKIEEAEATR
jgi:hypothetical protein